MKRVQFASRILLVTLLNLQTTSSAQLYKISPDGQEVTDLKTGLIWRRCAEGTTLIGDACTGFASPYSYYAALALAASETTRTHTAWRLPNVKELASIVDRNRENPAIDPIVFPGTPLDAFWSATPFVYDASLYWVVYFYDGNVGVHPSGGRGNVFYVRLVRAGQ